MRLLIFVLLTLAFATSADASVYKSCVDQCYDTQLECRRNASGLDEQLLCSEEIPPCEERCSEAALAARPPAREGGAYDKLMLLRPGIDDLGMTLGQWVACTEKFLHEAVAQGHRSPPTKGIDLVEDGSRVTVTLPGQTQDIHFDYVDAGSYMVMSAIRVGDQTTRNPDEFWQTAITFASACD